MLTENGDNELFKIGVTKSSVESRVKKLQTGNGNKLRCVASFYSSKPYKLEKMLHGYYSMEREEGEWFLLNREQTDKFIPLCEEYEKVIESLKDNPFF